MSIGNTMAETVTIPKREYKALKEKAKAFEMLVDSEGLSEKELARIKAAKKTKLLSEKEFFG